MRRLAYITLMCLAMCLASCSPAGGKYADGAPCSRYALLEHQEPADCSDYLSGIMLCGLPAGSTLCAAGAQAPAPASRLLAKSGSLGARLCGRIISRLRLMSLRRMSILHVVHGRGLFIHIIMVLRN